MRTSILLLAVIVMNTSTAARAEWSLTAYLGGARPHNASVSLDQPAAGTQLTFRDVPFTGDSFRSPLYYGYRVGYFFPRRVGLETEFIHQKVYAQTNRTVPVEGVFRGIPVASPLPMNLIIQRFSISHGLNLIFGNLVLRREFWREANDRRGRAMLTGRVGLGGTVSHAESEVLGVPQEQYEFGGLAFQVALGGEYHLWRGLYGIGEYKFTRTHQNLGIANGSADALLLSHHAIFGLAYHF